MAKKGRPGANTAVRQKDKALEAVANKAAGVPEDVDAAARRTVRETGETGMGSGRVLLFQLALAADEAPGWWSQQRDEWLRIFWRTAPFLPGVIYSIAGRNAAFRFEFTGPEAQVQYAKDLCAQADLGAGWQSFVIKVSQDLLCLAGPTRIHLGGNRRGQTKTIAQIVKQRDPGPVRSMDAQGHIVDRRIVEWHKTPLGDRRWWWVSLKDASMHSGERKGGIFLTEDHPVRTNKGWVLARDVRIGDKVASGDPEPSKEQAELMVGGLLGDMGIGIVKKRAMLRFSHSIKQEEWLDEKLRAFQGFQWTGRNYHEARGDFGHSVTVGINSRATLGLTEWRRRWYPQGKKIVVREDVERYFSPRMMAIWYCDDGALHRSYTSAGNETTPHGSLYTNAFAEEDVQWLVDFLCDKGMRCKLYKMKGDNKEYPYIHISNEGMRWLAQYIGACVPPIMRYKLPDGALPFDASLWDDIEPAKAFFDEVIESREKDYLSGQGRVKTTWHIGVEETGNFVAANTVVHNTQDNGAFIEVIRPARVRTAKGLLRAVKARDRRGDIGWFAVWRDQLVPIDPARYKVEDTPQDLPLGIAHLDAGRCTRTGDIEYPVLYRDRKGNEHKLAWWQVITLEDMPSAIEEMNGVGLCAVSRILRAAQTLRDIAIYRQEKVGGRFAGRVYITNADADAVTDGVRQAKTHADSQGLSRYMPPVIVQDIRPDRPVSLESIDLASLPDGFDEEVALRWYITEVALGTGVDYSYLAPLPGQGLGTATQVETMTRQTRGKSSRLFMNMLEFAFRYHGILPPDVDMNFIEVDEEEEAARDQAAKLRAETRAMRITSGEITEQVARQIAVDDGDLEPDYLEMMAEGEETPETTEEPSEPAGGAEPGDVTEEPEEKFLGRLSKAIGDRLQLRRPTGSGHEGKVNAYAKKLIAAFDEWAEKWAAKIAAAPEPDQGPLIIEAAEEIDEAMQELAKEALSEAYLLGLEGEELTDAGHLQVQNYTDRNLQFLEYSLGPDLRTKLKALGTEGLKDAGMVAGALGTFRGRVAMYAGPYWVLIWKGTEERAKERQGRENRVIPVTWHLDDRAEHCDECPRYAGEYKSWDEMVAATGGVPADSGASCGCNCRCWLTLG